VVGILAAALYNPVWTSSVRSFADVVIGAADLLAPLVDVRPSIVVLAITAAAVAFVPNLI